MVELKKLLQINQLVHVEIEDNKGVIHKYHSRVENLGDAEITLASPMKKRTPVYVPAGTVLNVCFWDKISIYSFQTVGRSSVDRGMPLLLVKYPHKVEKVQKREYVRVQANLSILLSYKDQEGVSKELWCQTRDISGGGIMLVASKPVDLYQGCDVRMAFQLEMNTIYLAGTVIRNDLEEDADGLERNILGIKFTNVNEKNRQHIIRYVFNRQIELRRKGLL